MDNTEKHTDRERLDSEHRFNFDCSAGLECFTRCCGDVTILLTPYDILRLKRALGLSSGDFLDRYTLIMPREDRLIPMVLLKMGEDDKRCPFVRQDGCSVYEDRPWPCRVFPLDMNSDGTFRIIAEKALCRGLNSERTLRISDWLIEQGVPVYDEMNAMFSSLTTQLIAEDLDIDNPKIKQMVFMALYNLDKFRAFVFESSFLNKFDIEKSEVEKIKRSDIDLLKLAYSWIEFGLFGKKTLAIRQEGLEGSSEHGL
jgi:Fe-S-cluster containining protein